MAAPTNTNTNTNTDETAKKIRATIRNVADFPTPGFVFRDVSPLLSSPQLLREVVEVLADHCRQLGVEMVGGIESRGFIFGSALALSLGVGFFMIRKKGKLPGKTVSGCYDQAYKKGQELELLESALDDKKGVKVVVVDDILSSGGSAECAIQLVESIGGKVVSCCFLCELPLGGRERLQKYHPFSILQYKSVQDVEK
eukprot:TRINITY_DN405_c0_g1_i1.p1 TRINITY_DN405_c0_g1~~TRINITY_DN405_c0_g1_i1.p1  ORF type:complete len:198 (-),score=71.82 TRINITY_DN405_c0_g1_i1:93-686(-)